MNMNNFCTKFKALIGLSRLTVGLGIFLRNKLAIATGIYNCLTAEREMNEERIICETWLTEEPSGIYAFARIRGKTYFRPGYFDAQKNDWVIPKV